MEGETASSLRLRLVALLRAPQLGKIIVRFQETHRRIVSDEILFLTVNKRTKLLEAMRNNPRDWRIDDLISVAHQLDIECRNHGGSHHVFSHPLVDTDVSVPAHRPIKPVYIRQFLLLVDAVKECPRWTR